MMQDNQTENFSESDISENQIVIDPGTLERLRKIGLSDVMSARVYEMWRKNAPDKIKEDPYNLMQIDGYGFMKADAIAKTFFSVKDDDPRRQRALIRKFLSDNTSFGHTYYPVDKLEKEISKFSVKGWEVRVAEDIRDGIYILDGDRLYLRGLYHAEVNVADNLKTRSQMEDRGAMIPRSIDLTNLDPAQQTAVRSFPNQFVMIITGGPGTGKTYVTKMICDAAEAMGKRVILCSPTGKAAKRLQELTGRNASTIHRMLGAGFAGEWKYNKSKLLRGYDYLICDESSMMDIGLAWRLLQAFPMTTKIIFVGDKDQLPPVGPGAFYRDIIGSQKILTVRLETNHRQGKGSLIAENALKINQGDLRLSFGDDDLVWIEAQSPIDVREKIMKLMPAFAADYNIIRDVQVLSPQKQGNVGVNELNELLRFKLNTKAKPKERFSVGDKVMQTVNDYQLNVFNGFVGEILSVGRNGYTIDFFDVGTKKYPLEKIDQLMLAYCCTVHKYQGSECQAGIFVVSSAHTFMLTRNLIYTAMTRFRETCIFLGDVIALSRACKNTRVDLRYSRLTERIQGVD